MKYIVSIILAVIVISCNNDDYLIDGGVASPYLNTSTYEFLASRPLFDTLVLAINKAGLKDLLDSEVTFFAPTDFAFKSYVDKMTGLGRTKYNDPNYFYKFDSIPAQVLHDSLSMYIFPGKIYRQDMRKEGDVFTNYAGTRLKISLEQQKDYTDQLTTNPAYVYLSYKKGKNWDAWDATDISTTEKDIKVRIQTSGLISNNGVVHVITNTHVLFFIE